MVHSFLFSSIRVIAFILVFAGAFCTAAGADVLSDNGFSGSPRAGCEPLTVAFSDDSSGATSWLWYFGDGTSSTAQHPVHIYTRPGFYSVTRIATQTRTQSSTKMVRNYIVVYEIPAVNFTAVPETGVLPLIVQFYDQSQGAYSWSWDFGDGARSTAQDPQHTYLAPGSYTVSLTVNNVCGINTAQKDNYVTVKGPKIDISRQNLAIPNGESYDFGPTNIGYVSTAEFQIENKGSGSLQLTSAPPVQISGTDAQYFEVVRQPAVTFPASQTSDSGIKFPFQIPFDFNFPGFPSFGPSLPETPPAGENSTFVIAFAPDDEGSYSATIEIASNDSDQDPYVIDVYGQAVDQSGIDSDQDGLPDLWEVRFGLDPDDPSDAQSDSDQDGKSNLDEYQQQSDPLSAEASMPFADDFEEGRLSHFWSPSSTAGGKIRVTGFHEPVSGAYHVTMAAARFGAAQLNELVLSLDLLGQSGVWLSFWHKSFGDEDHLMPQHFTGTVNADGVAISHDGINWHKLQGLTRSEGSSDEWQIFETSLDEAIAEAGIDYTNSFKIKFQQFDDSSIITFLPAISDGFAFDDVRVYLEAAEQSEFLSANTAGIYKSGNEMAAPPSSASAVDQNQTEEVIREIEEADIIKIEGTSLYILNQYRGLTVCNVSRPDSPTISGRSRINGKPIEMYIRDDYAYVIVSVLQEPVYGILKTDDAVTPGLSGAQSRIEVVNIADASNPRNLGALNLKGRITDSRIVGDILYVVSTEEPVYSLYRNMEPAVTTTNDANDGYVSAAPDKRNVYVASVDLSDPGNIREADRVDFGGSARYIHVTKKAIFIASDPSDYSYDSMNVTYVDISDPDGAIRKRGSFDVRGRIRDEWKMDYNSGYFRVCTYEWKNGGVSRLYTIDVTDPDAPRETGSVEVGRGEQLFATRFDGDRAYMVTFERKDPLWVIDLSDPTQPQIKGELIVPGWSTHIQPMGDHLVALGVDDTGGRRVSVSLFDVADAERPALIERVSFGDSDGWSSTTAYQDVKSFTVLEDMGLILLPYTTSSYTNGRYKSENRLQLIDYSTTDLDARGWVTQKGAVLRGRSFSDRLFSVSAEELQVIDASNRDNPLVTAELSLAVNVVDYTPLANGHGARVVESGGDYTLQAVPVGDPENPVGEIALGESGYASHFVNGNLVYIVANRYGTEHYRLDAGANIAPYPYEYTTNVTVFDFSTPTSPRKRGTIRIKGNYYTPIPLAGGAVMSPLYSNGEIVQVKGDVLAFAMMNSYRYYWDYDEPGAQDSQEFFQGLLIVDLSDPDRPKLAARHAIAEHGASGFFAKSGVLYYSYAVDAEDDDQERSLVKYYLGRVDMADPTFPESLSPVNIPGICLGMDKTGKYAYTIDSRWAPGKDHSVQYTFNAVRIKGGTAYLIGEVGLSKYYNRFVIADGFAYVSGYSWWCCGGTSELIVIDLTDPENLEKHESKLPVSGTGIIGAKNRMAFLSMSGGVGCYDVRNPGSPELTEFRYGYSWTGRVTFSGDMAFLPMGYYGLWVKNL